MLEGESVKESVLAAMSEGEGAPVESTPTVTPEAVSSPEVKVEEVVNVAPVVAEIMAPGETTPEIPKDARADQINNLNKALSEERDARKKLEDELGSVKPVFDKMKNVFAPEPVTEEVPSAQTEQEKFEQWYAQKEASKNEELSQQKLQELIKSQITDLSNKWNGEGGKPKYDDNEVYRWQRDNGKEYLTPEEAFTIMKNNDLVDWQARQVSSQAASAINAERPAGTSTEHTPSKTTPKTDQEIKNAVMEAMSALD